MTLQNVAFKEGDKVRIVKAVPTGFNGWNNSWESPMDGAVGKEGVIKFVNVHNNDFEVYVDGIGRYGFPVEALELATSPAPAQQAPVLLKAVNAPNGSVIVAPAGVSRKSQALYIARNLAVTLAKQNTDKRINADQVQTELQKLGFTSAELGNAAGTIFNKTNFIPVGMVRSTREGNNRRKITQWEYIGQ